MSNRIKLRIVSDGTRPGTHLYTEDGREIEMENVDAIFFQMPAWRPQGANDIQKGITTQATIWVTPVEVDITTDATFVLPLEMANVAAYGIPLHQTTTEEKTDE